MFERDHRIFANADPLDDCYRPETVRQREEQIEAYRHALQPVIDNRPASNIFIYGKTGTGKTVATRHMLSHLEVDATRYDDVELSVVWASCENLSSSYQAAVTLVNEIHRKLGIDRISTTGYSQQRVFDLLYQGLDELGGTVVVVLDEIDNIGRSDDILYGLPRARTNGYVELARPVVIGISNDLQFRDRLSPQVKDTLAEKEILFPPYNAHQLRSILAPRAEKAFYPGVLDDEVVPLCAAFAAQDTGSARQAIRLLRESGERAQSDGSTTVSERHVRRAYDDIQRNQLYEGVRDLTTQGHAVLGALSYCNAISITPVRSRDLYEEYVDLCRQLDMDHVSERRVRDHLADLDMLGIADVYEHNEGRSAGRFYEYELAVPLDVVLDVFRSTGRFGELATLIHSMPGRGVNVRASSRSQNEES